MSDTFVGQTIGPYRIEEQIGESPWGPVFRAVQSSVNRTVAVKILAPDLAVLSGKAQHFLEESRAAAQIVHPNIVAIFEAGNINDIHYCALEYMDGPPLGDFLRLDDNAVNEHNLLIAIAAVTRALDFLWSHRFPHPLPAAENILLNSLGTPKLKEISPTLAEASASPKDDILALGILIAESANAIGPVSKPVSELVERMVGAEGKKPIASLAELVQTAEALDKQLFPLEIASTSHIEKIKPQKKMLSFVIVLIAVMALIVGIVLYRWSAAKGPPPKPRPTDLGTMVNIPDTKFAMDKYEVTIGDYKQFLDAIAAGNAVFSSHPFTPRGKDFKPINWDGMLTAITHGGSFNGGQLTWDSPIFGVDWFDAYAYADWRKKRLPTEAEWNIAATNTPALKSTDQKWYDIFDRPADKSPAGIIGLAGNVAEWTASSPTRSSAVVRGGSWQDKNPSITNRLTVARDNRAETLGFRCAADQKH